MAESKSIKWFDWKFVIAAWTEKANRGGISIHAIATTCKRPPEIILQEMEHDETPGIAPYLCGGSPPQTWDLYDGSGMGLPAFGVVPEGRAAMAVQRTPDPNPSSRT